MTARWHLGPITGFEFWRVVVLSPEVMIFLFFMITDPKTTPESGSAAGVYAVSVALLAVLLIAPQVTEFWTKVALLGALWIVCAARPLSMCSRRACRRAFARPGALPARCAPRSPARRCSPACSCSPASPRVPRRPSPAPPPLRRRAAAADRAAVQGRGDADRPEARAADRRRSRRRPADRGGRAPARATRHAPPGPRAATRLAGLWAQIGAAGTSAIIVPERHVDKLQLELETAVGQDPPIVVAHCHRHRAARHRTTARRRRSRSRATTTPFTRTLELQLDGAATSSSARAAARPRRSHPARRRSSSRPALGGAQLENVAPAVGIDFQQNAFRRRRRWT